MFAFYYILALGYVLVIYIVQCTTVTHGRLPSPARREGIGQLYIEIHLYLKICNVILSVTWIGYVIKPEHNVTGGSGRRPYRGSSLVLMEHITHTK